MPTLGIVGCGWTGQALAHVMQSDGWQVWGSRTSSERVQALEADGVKGVVLALEEAFTDTYQLPTCDAMVLSFPPSGKSGSRHLYAERIRRIVNMGLEQQTRHFIMLSSTSVYANTQGWAYEDSKTPMDTQSEVYQGEQAFLQALEESPHPKIIFRLAGLMGPGRHPGRRLSGRRIPTSAYAPVNLVHRDDVVASVQWALEKKLDGVFNICCGTHPSKMQCYGSACRRLGIDLPLFDDDKAPSFKVISRQRWIREHGYRYRHSDVIRSLMRMEAEEKGSRSAGA